MEKPSDAGARAANNEMGDLHDDQTGAAPNQDRDKDDLTDDIDPENEVTGVKLLLIHTGICLCTFLVGLDFNLIATAVPVITQQFDSIHDVGWYGASFMVALCATQPLAGKTFTLFPTKPTYLAYLLIFEIGSLVCALAPSSPALIAGRAIAGLGASGIFAGGFAILTTIVPLHKRAIYTGTMSSTFAVASIIGPVLSGAFTQHATWRWDFYINLPIGGVGSVLFFFLVYLRPAETEKVDLRTKFIGLDFLGLTLFAGSITMLLLALQLGGAPYPWSSSTIIGLFVGAGVTILFIAWQLHRKDEALVPPRLFQGNRNPALLCASSFFVNGPFQVIIYWLPIWFQGVLGDSPVQSGINYFPTVLGDVFAAFIGSGIVMQLGWWNPFLLFAECLVCIGGGLLSSIYPDIPGSHWIGYQIFGGVGYSLATNLAHLAMQASLPQALVPIGASTLLAVISTSCAIFLAVGQAIFQKRLVVNLGRILPLDVVEELTSAGVVDLGTYASGKDLPVVVSQYSKSITQVFYIPAAAPVFSFLLVACCKWISSKSRQAKPQSSETAATDDSRDKEQSSGMV